MSAIKTSEEASGDQGMRRRFAVLSMLLAITVVTFAGRWISEHNRPPKNALHGDSEEALKAIEPELARLPEVGRLPFLLKSVRDSHAGLRYAAVDGLARYHTPESAAAIENSFRDSASTVRQRAAETLHAVDHERGLLLLLSALQDEDTWIRQTAATQLALRAGAKPGSAAQPARASITKVAPARPGNPGAMIADRRVVPALIRALDDRDDTVVRQSVTMLRALTGHSANYRTIDGPQAKHRAIADWKTWWATHANEYLAPPAFAGVHPIRPTRTDPAPEFDLSDIDGHPMRLSDLKGRVVLVNFWGTWCAPCRQELSDIEKLHETHDARGLTVIGAAVSETGGPAGLRSWCAKNHLTYRQSLSTPGLQEAYGEIEEVPVTVMIDKLGQIRYRWEGPRDLSTFQAAVERLLAE